MRTSRLALLAALFLPAAWHLNAEVIFEESFDTDPPYASGGRLPLGFGKITYGKWYADNFEGFPIEVRDEKFRSEPMSLMLEATREPDEPSKIARAWASWGVDNQAATVVTQPMVFSCAFLASRVDGDEDRCAQVSISGHSAVAICSVYVGVGGTVAVRNQDGLETVGQIVADQWYVLEIRLPAAENPQTPMTVTLYESQGTERGKAIGSIQLPDPKPGSVYQGFRWENRLPESKIYIDDCTASIEG